MIASVSGTVTAIAAGTAVVEANGLGYEVHLPTPTLASLKVGGETRLYTQMVVREDAMSLYGFDSGEARQVFNHLLQVSGVGGKVALQVLSFLSPADLRKAVAAGDIEALTEVPGVGKRSAQRMVLELKERLGVASDAEAPGGSRAAEVREALMGLGYTAAELREVVGRVVTEDTPVEEAVKAALKELAHR